MNTLKKLSPAEAKARLAEFRKSYSEGKKGDNFSALIMGEFASGKTSLLGTARAPILIDSFDPRGAIVLRDEIKSGRVIVRDFWDERFKRPTEYSRWAAVWDKDTSSGFFDTLGTYCIDSLTTFTEALVNQYCKQKGRAENKPEIQDYPIIYSILKDVVKSSQSHKCDFLCTGHLVAEMDARDQKMYAELDTYKKLKSRLPLLFTEKYVITNEPMGNNVRYELLTAPNGRYRAGTQLGAKGKFKLKEEPDIKALLKKAGFPHEDLIL